MKREQIVHMCEIFFCDKRGDRQCCFYCEWKKKCKNHCLNNPEKCGKYFFDGGKEKDA